MKVEYGKGEMFLGAKCLSGLIHKMKNDDEVKKRWINNNVDVNIDVLEALLNRRDERIAIRKFGIAFKGIKCEGETLGVWLFMCLHKRFSLCNETVNTRLLLEFFTYLATSRF